MLDSNPDLGPNPVPDPKLMPKLDPHSKKIFRIYIAGSFRYSFLIQIYMMYTYIISYVSYTSYEHDVSTLKFAVYP